MTSSSGSSALTPQPRPKSGRLASRTRLSGALRTPAAVGTTQARPNDPTGIDGFPAYADLLERYATRTGRDLSEIDYYIAFGSFRLAVISEGVYARYLHGAMGDQEISDEQLDAFKVGTEILAESALEAMQRL